MMKPKKNTVPPPADFESLQAHVAKNQDDLPKRLAQVARYALQNPDDIAFGTTVSIASAVGLQPSTLVRLANHLGYDGFTAFQDIFRERLRDRAISYDERFNALEARNGDGKEESIQLNDFLSAARKSIDYFEATSNPETLKQAVATLTEADTIYILAKRRSYPLAAHMAYIFSKLKMRHHIVGTAIGNDNELIEMATPDDAAIAISFSPYAPETISQVQIMAKNKVPIVGITDSAFSPLTSYCTPWIEIVEADFAGFRSLSASIALSVALPVAVAKSRRKIHKNTDKK